MIKNTKKDGFTLIELLIVIAIIGILAAIAVPSYLGMQERGRRGAVERACNGNVPELQGWINAVKKGGTMLGGITEIDTNGDTQITAADDNNNTLATTGVVTQFIATSAARGDTAPWVPIIPLFTNGGVAVDQAACNAIASGNPGQVTLCYTPDENQSIRYIYLSATNLDGAIFYSKPVSAD